MWLQVDYKLCNTHERVVRLLDYVFACQARELEAELKHLQFFTQSDDLP